jgi:hypothetical protein
MKPKVLGLTLALGLVAGLLACQDESIVSPNDLSPSFAVDCDKKPNHPHCPDPPDPGGGSSTVNVRLETGVVGEQSGLEPASGKKDLFTVVLTNTVITNFTKSYENWLLGNCTSDPEGADVDALAPALLGESSTTTSVRADTTKLDEASDENRIGVFQIETDGVRYVQLGTSGLFPELSPKVTDWVSTDTQITFTMRGGVVIVRSDGSPSRAVKLVCPNPPPELGGDVVYVTVVRESN